MTVKPAFSYFGGKSRIAKVIWQAFGDVSNYVEPFAGSLSVLFANPNIPKVETVNEIDPFISNFYRSIAKDPDGVAKYADYPVHETEIHARHSWLVSQATNKFHLKMNSDPDYFDAKIAGYWVYGMCGSVGNNWLNTKGLKALPLLSSAGGGIQGLTYDIKENFKLLQDRLKRVRVCCGDWKRIMTPSITYNSKALSNKDITGIFLDPPYNLKGRDKVYKEDSNIFNDVCDWAIANDNPRLRIAVCGYLKDYPFPDTWQVFNWKGSGMGNMGDERGKDNLSKETVWFSPACLKAS